MPRPKSPCGTYPAYQRHLREKTAVDEACRRAQQTHDAGRGRTWRDDDAERPVLVPVAAPEADIFTQRTREARARFSRSSEKLSTVVDVGDLYTVIDLIQELDRLLDAWIFAADEADASRDFADHPEELRKNLIASWLDLARDVDAGSDEISDELRARVLSRNTPEI